MKVCLLTRFFDMRNAGLGRVSSEIRNGMQHRGHEVHAISTNGTSLPSYFMYTAAEIPFRLPRGYDIYHAVTPMEAAWIPKRKAVVTFHDLFQISHPDKIGAGLSKNKFNHLVGTNYFKLVVNIAKNCAGIVAVSELTAQDLVTYLDIAPNRIFVIHSGIRPDFEPITQPFSSPKGHIIVGYLGQLDRRKRVDMLIRAFKKCDLGTLTIGGMGVDAPYLKTLAEDDPRIAFEGLVPDKDLLYFYNSMDVFVFPTWLEGYGLPIIEAMACKRPVVVMHDARIPWELKKRCVITDDLEVLLRNEKYLRRRCEEINYDENYRWAKAHSWDSTIDKYEEVYRRVLNA